MDLVVVLYDDHLALLRYRYAHLLQELNVDLLALSNWCLSLAFHFLGHLLSLLHVLLEECHPVNVGARVRGIGGELAASTWKVLHVFRGMLQVLI